MERFNKHYAGKNLYSVIISRSQTNNKNIKYKDNDESQVENLSLNYRSDEIENKFRTENTFRLPFIQLNVGGNIEYAQYTNDTYQKQFTSIPRTIVYQTDLAYGSGVSMPRLFMRVITSSLPPL